MTLKGFAALVVSVVLSSSAFGESRPALTLCAAAKLAEEAIASIALPAHCFMRSVTLVEPPGAPAYYRATYKPASAQRAETGLDDAQLDYIRIGMDGDVTFVSEQMAARRLIRLE